MHEIGNEDEARQILYWVRASPRDYDYARPQCVTQEEAPEGWEYVGTGSFRSVWLSPTGVAYKVEHGSKYSHQSEEEATNLNRAWSKGAPEGCRLPKWQRFVVDEDETIIAIELIRGVTLYEYSGDIPHDELYDRLSRCETHFKLYDLHDSNVIIDEDGYLVPVDLGN